MFEHISFVVECVVATVGVTELIRSFVKERKERKETKNQSPMIVVVKGNQVIVVDKNSNSVTVIDTTKKHPRNHRRIK